MTTINEELFKKNIVILDEIGYTKKTKGFETIFQKEL